MKPINKYLQVLKQIFPLSLLYMVLYIQIIVCITNFSDYDFREMVIWLCWIPIGLIPFYISKKKMFYYLFLCILFTDNFINLSHWLLLKGDITASSLFILINTNFSESVEFMTLKGNYNLLLLLPFILLFIYALRKIPPSFNYKEGKYVLGIIMLSVLIYFSDNIIHQRFVRKAVPASTKAMVFFSQEIKTYNSLKKRNIKTVKALTDDSQARVFVLIIGESCSRNHMSLYNYHRNTNVKLKNRKDIIVYDNVVSSHSNTIFSLGMMLSESDLENNIEIDNSVFLADIFHAAGFKTYWISNQSPLGVWDNAVYNMARLHDKVVYENKKANSSFESTLKASFDEVLFAPFKEALSEKIKNKCIMLHLMGSHSSYAKRYPANFSCFNTDKDKVGKTVNTYDNSILYNDFIMDSLLIILTQYASNDTNTLYTAIYLSDHGENVYDENNNAGHDYTGSLPKSNVEIPFIVWLSPQYINKYPSKSNTILNHKHKPFISNGLFHAVLDLNHIQTYYFDRSKSVFHLNYNAKRKRILEDKMDYDLK